MQTEHREWLEKNIQGLDLLLERSNLVTHFVQIFPHASLRDIQELDEELKSRIYQTHKRFEIEDIKICACKKVFKKTILTHIDNKTTLESLKEATCAGTGCGKCVPELLSMIEAKKPRSLRWHGETHSYWSGKVQESLELWNQRVSKYPPLLVSSFDQGQVKISVDGTLNSDQEWELSNEISDYLAEGFPEPLVVFLDFSHSAANC